MKIHSKYTQMSKERFDIWTKNFDTLSPPYENHPREDYHLCSEKYPIFIVADGVTLKRDINGVYPVPSGAYQLAKMFCEMIITEAEKMYVEFSEQSLEELFSKGNTLAKEFNESNGRLKNTINYREFDLFAATTSFVLIKENRLFWWSLNDSGIVCINEKGETLFQSPNAWPDEKEKIAQIGNTSLTDTEFNKLKKKLFRNSVDENGKISGYGVLTGEPEVALYLNKGSFDVKSKGIVLLYTDGYEDYVKMPQFIDLFTLWSDKLDLQLDSLVSKAEQENPKLFGRERSIIAVKI